MNFDYTCRQNIGLMKNDPDNHYNSSSGYALQQTLYTYLACNPMKILLLFTCSILLLNFTVIAQPFPIERSEGFNEPFALGSKVVQCKNGNTFLCCFTSEKGIEIRLFGKDRKLLKNILYQARLYDFTDMNSSHIHGIYEVNNELVIFLEQTKDKVPRLYRTRINAVSGAVAGEEQILQIDHYKPDRYPVKLAGVIGASAFRVAKDAASDNYAVVAFNGLAEGDPHRIEIQLFNKNHEIIRKGWYDNAASADKMIRFTGLCVANEQVYLSTFRYSKADSADLYLSSLNSTSAVEHKASGLHKDFKNSAAAMQWNAGDGKVELLTSTYLESTKRMFEGAVTNTYRNALSTFDGKSLDLLTSRAISYDPVIDYEKKVTEHKSIFGGMTNQNLFDGMAMGLMIHGDKSTTVLLQQMQNNADNATPGTVEIMKSRAGDIGSIHFDENMQPGNGYFMPALQDFRLMIPPCAVNDRQATNVSFQRKKFGEIYIDPGYYGFDCFLVNDVPYVTFNDNQDNFFKQLWGARNNLVAISEGNTAIYKLTGAKATPEYLLGKPDEETSNRFANIASASYDAATHTYAILIVEKKRHEGKQACVAWINFQ